MEAMLLTAVGLEMMAQSVEVQCLGRGVHASLNGQTDRLGRLAKADEAHIQSPSNVGGGIIYVILIEDVVIRDIRICELHCTYCTV